MNPVPMVMMPKAITLRDFGVQLLYAEEKHPRTQGERADYRICE
jgi:hypothetical protein